MEKVFKTHQELIGILRERGVNIKKGSGEKRVAGILEKENYYNVINGYKELFVDEEASQKHCDEVYKTGTSFNEIYALYCFDREIRMIHLKYLLRIENHFKSVLSHNFSAKYGHDNYLKLDNFHCTVSHDCKIRKRIAKEHNLNVDVDGEEIDRISTEENVANVYRLIGDIQQEIARQLAKHHPMVSHYMVKHGYIPLWVLVNVLTFGKVTDFFLHMKESDKTEIAKQFKVHPKELHKYMTMLGFARNKCAHDERFYSIRFKQKIHTKSIPYFKQIGLPSDKSGYLAGIDDAFAVAIIFKQMLTKSEFSEFTKAMDSAFKRLGKQLNTISIVDVQNRMGYPPKWKEIERI